MTSVEVPKVGNTVEECLVSRWLKQKGDSVSAGDVIAELTVEDQPVGFDLFSTTVSWIGLILHNELAPPGSYKIREGHPTATRLRRTIRQRVSHA